VAPGASGAESTAGGSSSGSSGRHHSHSAVNQTPPHSSKLSNTAALPMSLDRLDKACHSGPTRSIADSTAVLSNSTTSTAKTTPTSKTTSTQLWPSHQAPGKITIANIASCRNAGSSHPARKPSSE
jgi:hypothetical protein